MFPEKESDGEKVGHPDRTVEDGKGKDVDERNSTGGADLETGDRGDSVAETVMNRRNVLALGAGATGLAVGLGTVPGRAVAWKRFDVDFKATDEVWFIVGDDLRYDPPAVTNVIVEREGKIACDLVECTTENATTVPAQYEDASVVQYTTDGTVLGVLPYNRPIGDNHRFSRPRCVMTNDKLTTEPEDEITTAECVQAAIEGDWSGKRRDCWFDPVEPDGPVTVETSLHSPDPDPARAFGSALEGNRTGDILVIGSPATQSDVTGAAYIFANGAQSWHHIATFAPEESVSDFGSAVDIDAAGKRVIVGAPAIDDGSIDGSAYVFTASNGEWKQTAKLLGDGKPAEEFGRSVSLDGDGKTAVVGATYDGRAAERGRAFVFDHDDDWMQSEVLFVPCIDDDFGIDGEEPDWGRSCRISDDGETILVAGPNVGFTFGEVRAFTKTGGSWVHAGLLARGLDSHSVGFSLDVVPDGTTCLIGANVSSPDTIHPEGFALRTTELESPWVSLETERLTPDDGEVLDGFGRAVATDSSGQLALVGAPMHDPTLGGGAGAVYLFSGEETQTQVGKFVPADGTAGDNFGAAVSTNGPGTVGFVGSPDAENVGFVYVIDLDNWTALESQYSRNGTDALLRTSPSELIPSF